MTFGSVCSGIEAASVAWSPLGWRAAWLSEIEPFCCALLKHHHPAVPNLGDMQGIGKDSDDIDVLVGGTPCQSFSVAGLRKGLDDPRGNLALVFLRLADLKRPRWVVWENVPGVLSSGGGRDFGSFLGGLGQLGYGFAYRVLDAQYVRVESHARAVPQRRRRVFVVGYLGDWRRAGAVLLERESLRGDSPPRRTAGEGTAGTTAARASAGGGLGTDFDLGGGLVPECSPAMKARDSKGPSSDGDGDGLPLIPVAHSLRAEGHDASEDGTGRGVPLVAIPMMANGACGSNGAGIGRPGDPAMSLDSSRQAVAYGISPDCLDRSGEGAGGSAAERSGLGVEAELAYSIRAKRAGAVAFQTRIARNGRGQPNDIAPALSGADAGATSDMRPCVAITGAGGYHTRHADAPETRSVEALRVLRHEVGEEAFAQWSLGVLAALWPQEVLRPEVYGCGLRREGVSFNGLVHLSLSREKDGEAGAVRALWEAGGKGCPPPGWGHSEQSARELAAHLSLLPQSPSPAPRFLCLVWEASEGARLLRQALSTIREVRRSACVQAESAHAVAVRRLTVEECEALQGFPRGYTSVPYRGKPAADGPRYRALGNSIACNVLNWIGQRIEMADAIR